MKLKRFACILLAVALSLTPGTAYILDVTAIITNSAGISGSVPNYSEKSFN